MPTSVQMTDFEVNGEVDWQAYHKAQIANGEVCTECGSFITFPKGHHTVCRSCELLKSDNEEISHNSLIRCPQCGDTFAPADSDDYELMSDGEHDVCCNECGFDFVITTDVSWMFTSPPKIESS